MKDILEKFIVILCALVVIGIITFCSVHHASVNDNGCEQTDTCIIAPEDDFEVECIPAEQTDEPQPSGHLVSYNGRYFSYSRKFADRNDMHLAAAQAIGLSHGPDNRAEAEKMHNNLREINTGKYYVVEELTHSLPYLVPTAANRLDSIGKEFYDILMRNNLPHYRFRVTSVLRSQEDIRRLKRCNSNSISNSPHNYGTTFDLGYWHYDKVSNSIDYMTEDNLKLVLAQVLLNQQRDGHIYVKYEHQQSCFHVTVRN